MSTLASIFATLAVLAAAISSALDVEARKRERRQRRKEQP